MRTHSAVVKEQGARIPARLWASRAAHPTAPPSAARGSKPAFLPAAILIPSWSGSEIYTSCRLLTGTLDTPPRAVTDILKFHKLSQSQPEYSAY